MCYNHCRRIIAATQFETVFARSAFPCFDEPSFKARFKLSINRPKTWMTLFNSQLAEPAKEDGAGMRDSYGYMSALIRLFVEMQFIKKKNYVRLKK